jgi:hypothetical protein
MDSVDLMLEKIRHSANSNAILLVKLLQRVSTSVRTGRVRHMYTTALAMHLRYPFPQSGRATPP